MPACQCCVALGLPVDGRDFNVGAGVVVGAVCAAAGRLCVGSRGCRLENTRGSARCMSRRLVSRRPKAGWEGVCRSSRPLNGGLFGVWGVRESLIPPFESAVARLVRVSLVSWVPAPACWYDACLEAKDCRRRWRRRGRRPAARRGRLLLGACLRFARGVVRVSALWDDV
jgi:hypothetical protein